MTITAAQKKLLQEAANNAQKQAYAPYSGVARGAALLSEDYVVYAGCNVEFVTYGGSVCAELAALTAAVADGKRKFRALYVVPAAYPCGNCRQFLREFGLDITVIMSSNDGELQERPLSELLPSSFGPDHLTS